MTAFVTIGSVALRRELVGALAVGAVAAVATGGAFISMRRPRKAYLALTTRRLMFFDGETFLGRPGKLLFTLPKQAVQVVTSGKFGLGLLRVELAIEGESKGLRINFAPGSRETGYEVVAALEAVRRRNARAREDHWPGAEWHDQRPGQNWDDRRQSHAWDTQRPQNRDNRQSPQPRNDRPPRRDWDGQWPQDQNGQRRAGYR